MHASLHPRMDDVPSDFDAERSAMSTDAARSNPLKARPVPRWLLKIMHERHGAPHTAEGQGAEAELGPLVCACSPEHERSVRSRDLGGAVQECSGSRVRQVDLQRGFGEEQRAPAAVAEGEVAPPPLPAHADLDLVSVSPSSRHSYGDFSSASSTASSSTSHSGFSSTSASSFTSASSTQTFSAAAAGWTAATKACPPPAPVVLQSLAAAVEHAVSEGDAPAAVEVLARDFEPPSALASHCLDALFAASPDTPLRCRTSPAVAHSAAASDVPSRPSTACSLSEPASSVTLNGIPTSSLHRTTPPRAPSPSAASSATGADEARTSDGTDDEPDDEDGTLHPPENFAMVSPRVYRSSFPRTRNFPFLRSLGLKSVMVLVQEPYPEENLEFLKAEGIQFFQFGIPGNKEPFVSIPEEKIVAALSTILDARNHPMLIHCNKGKHRTGCVVGCLRRLQTWSLTSIFDEYRRYSHPKSRAMDLQCIEAFGGLPKVWETVTREHLPQWPLLDPPSLPSSSALQPSPPSAAPDPPVAARP